MALGGNTAELVFNIKADGSQAKREMGEMQTSIGSLGGKLGGLANPATIATAAFAALGAAAVAVTKQLFDLTLEAAKYGAAMKDASDRTGLTAKALSGLKYAAEQGGSSFEAASNAVAKFNVLLGQAAAGNEKAQQTLEKYKITATDTDTALKQAIATIDAMSSSTDKAAASAELFKDRTGQLLPVIAGMSGDLEKASQRAIQLGVAIDDQAAAASKRLDDTMLDLRLALQGVSLQLGNAMIPHVQKLAEALVNWFIRNQDLIGSLAVLVGTWMERFVNALIAVGRVAEVAANSLRGFANSISSAIQAIANIIPSLRLWLALVERIHQVMARIANSGPVGASMGGSFDPARFGGAIRTGGGGGGGGSGSRGRGGADRAAEEARRAREQAIQEEIATAQRIASETIAIYKATSAEKQAILRRELEQGLISEREYVRESGRLKIEAAMDELRIEQDLLAKIKAIRSKIVEGDSTKAAEDALIQRKQALKLLEIELRKIKTEAAIEAIKFINAEIAAIDKLIEAERRLRDARAKKAGQSVIDEDRRRNEKLASDRAASQGFGIGGTDRFGELMESFRTEFGADNVGVIVAGIETISMAFSMLGQAVGSAVEAFVLYGGAGTSVQKVTAQLLASIAKQATIKAIFELAEGFAALARSFLFGDPAAAAAAKMHFKSAATYGIIAGIAAGAGRGVAGNSFSQGAAAGAARGGGPGATTNGSQFDALSGGAFRGFGTSSGNQFAALNRTLERVDRTIAQTEKTLYDFQERFGVASPGDVVMAGAGAASREIRGALEAELSHDSGTTDAWMRGAGFVR